MKKGFVLWNGLLEKLAEDDELENIILGTGKMARDMQTKLRLLNIKVAPFLIGGVDDIENGIRHYESIRTLDNPQSYRFICCYDVDEWALITPAYSAVYKALGDISWNHPKVLRLSSGDTLFERTGEYCIDTHVHDYHLCNGRPYSVFAMPNDGIAFKVHMLGTCTVSGTYLLNEQSVPKGLCSNLCDAGFKAVVYSWGQPANTSANGIIQFIRDIQYLKPDLVILFTSIDELNPISVTKRNSLYVNTGLNSHRAVRRILSLYGESICNGVNHDVDMPLIGATQNKIFRALSKQLNFSFWNVFSPSSSTISLEQSKQLLNLSEGYFSRATKRKDAILHALSSPFVKDYTDTFDSVDDIFSVFGDKLHFTDKGNEMIVKRLALDILTEFGDKNKNF